ncbi:MAG: site-specific DNA-methyltransferase [Ferruginibacter sp.]|nr:site-specific DNA-methyltransferase [Ferruginibacter sp.]
MQDLYKELIQLLEADQALIIDDKLNKGLIIDRALRLDTALIKLLLTNPSIKKQFFVDIEGILVFDKVAFQRFVNAKNFLPDSYTQYKNKIGLSTDNDHYITDSREVVLVWPHKDCVLEGGQTKEDAKRNEIFYNTTLAPDEIDVLTAPKVLTNWKRYDKDGETIPTKISKADNLIIKGNNLLALHTLKEKYRGQIKLIYIDPPYNTGNDSFGYNDNFNHSTWLTFMKNRLEVAKILMKEIGVIFVSLDDKEAHYCKILMDEVFGRENFIADICHKSRASISNDKIISPNHNHILLYAKNERLVFGKKEKFGIKKSLNGFKLKDDKGDYKLVPVDGPGGAVKGNPFYTFEGIEGYWRFSEDKMRKMFNEGLVVRTASGLQQKYYKEKAAKSKQTITTWWDENFLTSSATSQLKSLMGDDVFKNPKNVNLIKRIVELWTENDDIILDYHGGSGTTAQAVLDLNVEDGGERKFIMCEQMDYAENVTCKRVHTIINNNQIGSFIYAELMQSNQNYIAQVQEAQTTKELLKIWDEMQATAFISYKVLPQNINNEINNFEALSYEEQQRFLVEILDKNLLYVNKSEINDATHKVTEYDKEMNAKFYNM